MLETILFSLIKKVFVINKEMEFISLEQKRIVTDLSRIKKVSGCAGSRKTDTMIKCAIYNMMKAKRPQSYLFLTLVGSVTDEITSRIETMLKIKIEKQGASNHYVGKWNQHTIEVSNFDAFIHRQLQEYEDNDILFTDDFEKKAEQLFENFKKHNPQKLLLKNGESATFLLVDEFQDISYSRVQILIEYFKVDQKTKLIVLGDILQTIFPQALKERKHPLIMINELKPTEFRLNICFRCPKSHLEVVNCITKPFRKQYLIPDMESNFDLTDKKPFFFTHDALSSHAGTFETAKTIFKMIEILIDRDKDISFGDIVILMKKSNHQLVFQNLVHFFIQNKWNDKFMVSRTKSCLNEHIPINWQEGRNKCMMLSIHGDKGKGHKAVFVIGFSGGVIPEERHFYRMEELLSQSLLNVSLTRSSKYLFVGMTRTFPSIYFSSVYHQLKNIAYFSWKPIEIQDEIISEMAKVSCNDIPLIHRSAMRKNSLCIPLKNIIYVHHDDKCKNLVKRKPKITRNKIGHLIRVFQTEEKLYVLQRFVKLLFLKKIRFSLFVSIFELFIRYIRNNDVYYTDDNELLCVVKDYHLNQYIEKKDYWKTIAVKFGWKQFPQPKLILHEIFQSSLLQNLVRVCSSPETNNGIDLWNVTIFFIEYIDTNQGFQILLQFDQMFDDLTQIELNIDHYIEFYKKMYPNGFGKLRIHQKSSMMDIIQNNQELEELGFQNDLDIDKKIFMEGYRFGISSIIDIVDKENKVIIDFRISLKSECREEWVIQNLIHSIVSDKNKCPSIKQIHVFNILRGIVYVFQYSSRYTIQNTIQPLLELYEFDSRLISRIIS